MDLPDIAAFVAVVEAGSFSEAARRRHTTKSALSRRVSTLEAMLGVPLLERQARGVSTNEVGAVFYAKCVRILEAVESASDFATGFGDEIRGRLRVAVARDDLMSLAQPALLRFGAQYPAVQLEITRMSSVVADGEGSDPDVRVVAGEIAGRQWVVTPLLHVPRLLCAAPGYLSARGMPNDVAALETHDALLHAIDDGARDWTFVKGGDAMVVRPRERLRSSESAVLQAAAEEGLGLVLLPAPTAADALVKGRLVRVLPGWEASGLNVSLVHNSSRRGARKLQLLLAALVDSLARLPAGK